MKKIYFLLLGIVICINLQEVKAQQLDAIQRGQRGYVPPQKINNEAYVEIKDPYEETNIILPICVEEFKLDAFEKEIFKGMLIKNIESQNAILSDKKDNYDARKKKLQDISNDFYKELSSILTEEEIEKYKVMDFKESKEDKKKKKKDKRKKRKTE